MLSPLIGTFPFPILNHSLKNGNGKNVMLLIRNFYHDNITAKRIQAILPWSQALGYDPRHHIRMYFL